MADTPIMTNSMGEAGAFATTEAHAASMMQFTAALADDQSGIAVMQSRMAGVPVPVQRGTTTGGETSENKAWAEIKSFFEKLSQLPEKLSTELKTQFDKSMRDLGNKWRDVGAMTTPQTDALVGALGGLEDALRAKLKNESAETGPLKDFLKELLSGSGQAFGGGVIDSWLPKDGGTATGFLDGMQAGAERFRELWNTIYEEMKNRASSAIDAFISKWGSATEVARQQATLVLDTLTQVGSLLIDSLFGDADFRVDKLFKNLAKQLLKLTMNHMFASILGGLFGSTGTDGVRTGGLLGGLFGSPAQPAAASAPPLVGLPSPFAAGRSLPLPLATQSASYGAPGASVAAAAQPFMAGRSMPVMVNVEPPSGYEANVAENQSAGGGTSVDLTFNRMMAQGMNTYGSPANKALRAGGFQPMPVRKGG